MTTAEYTEYEERVATFMHDEGLSVLSPGGDETWFSWSPCECCQRPTGGTREQATAYHVDTGSILSFNICTDCVYYATYGSLDDQSPPLGG